MLSYKKIYVRSNFTYSSNIFKIYSSKKETKNSYLIHFLDPKENGEVVTPSSPVAENNGTTSAVDQEPNSESIEEENTESNKESPDETSEAGLVSNSSEPALHQNGIDVDKVPAESGDPNSNESEKSKEMMNEEEKEKGEEEEEDEKKENEEEEKDEKEEEKNDNTDGDKTEKNIKSEKDDAEDGGSNECGDGRF